MDKEQQHKLQELRQRIPIGLKYGLTLLEKTYGNIKEAERVFQQECRDIVIKKTKVNEKTAIKHLQKNNYNISLALETIDEERYTISERIIKRYKDKEEALGKIAFAVEEKEKLVRNFWLDFSFLDKLEPEVFCLVILIEWLDYESYEGLDYAIYFHLDIVINEIEKNLLLPQITKTLNNARKIYEKQLAERKEKSPIKKITDQTQPAEFTQQANIFQSQRPLLINTLYEFVKTHIKKFP